MDATIKIFNDMVAAFLAAIQNGGGRLAGAGFALLGVLFIISYCRQFGAQLATGVGSLGDALGRPLLFIISGGLYLYVLQNLIPMTNALLDAAVTWGMELSGVTTTRDLMRSPGAIIQMGLDVARPIASFDTTWQAIKTTIGLVGRPDNLIIFWLILVIFIATAVHFGMLLIEFALSVSLSYVLLPWGIWQASESIGFFAIGWVSGCAVRALVSCAILGVALPLFDVFLVEPTGPGFFHIGETVGRVVCTVFFGAIALAVPRSVANWASRAGLAMTGSTVAAGAMTFARWGMLGHHVVRGFSQLVGR
jgi:type IV secretion system protein TrbL